MANFVHLKDASEDNNGSKVKNKSIIIIVHLLLCGYKFHTLDGCIFNSGIPMCVSLKIVFCLNLMVCIICLMGNCKMVVKINVAECLMKIVYL